MITQIAFKDKIRLNSRTSEPSSVQIAGAIIDTAFSIDEKKGTQLINDELFAVSQFLKNNDSEPEIKINDFLTISGKIVNPCARKKLESISCKLSELNKLDQIVDEMIRKFNTEEKKQESEEENKSNEEKEIFMKEGTIYRISNSRPNTKDKTMFYYKVIELNSPFLLVNHSPQNKEILIEALKELAYTGIGADKTIGLGAFSNFEIKELKNFEAGTKRVNLSHYIPSNPSTRVQSRITKYIPYDSNMSCEVLCHRPFGIVELDKEVDGQQIQVNNKNKVLNFRSILLPVKM